MSLVNNQDAYVVHMIADSGHKNIQVRGRPLGYRFLLRLPNFRGNYLSCVEKLEFSLDGNPIDLQQVFFHLNDKRFRIAVLPELFAEYWECNDYAAIEVLSRENLEGEHEVGVLMCLRYAYSAYFGVCKVVTSHCRKKLTFQTI
jgi:hypothetical protein